jgi:MFS transporter, YNFM family, putative membrane transport protein
MNSSPPGLPLPAGSALPKTATGRTRSWLRPLLIGLTAFLTLVDLFATQAILPTLAQRYGVSPAAMGFAVNASTLGMAVAGLLVAAGGRYLDRRRGIVISLALLAVPTALLAQAPDVESFAWLRIAQGVCMATAFTLTLSYLAEHCGADEAAGAFAAYVTGNVASNLLGRLMSAALANQFGVAGNFHAFAALNLAGAVLVFFALRGASAAPAAAGMRTQLSIWMEHLRNPALRLAFTLGFLILFAFLGVFTYVNFVLVRTPLSLSPMTLGLVYFVFLPAIFTTPLAGRAVARVGTRKSLVAALLAAGAGLPLLLAPYLPLVLTGMVLVACGTFFAQAISTGFVGRVATTDRASANGIYLACYFSGGLVGAAVLGQLFDRAGWATAVAAVALVLVLAAALAARIRNA